MDDKQRKKWEQLRDRFISKHGMYQRMKDAGWREDAAHFAKQRDAIRDEMDALGAEAAHDSDPGFAEQMADAEDLRHTQDAAANRGGY